MRLWCVPGSGLQSRKGGNRMRRHHNHQDATTLERVAELHQSRLIIPNDDYHMVYHADETPHYRNAPSGLSTTYGDWSEVTNTTPINPAEVYLIPGYCGGSDYSGNLVEVSNHKALLDIDRK